MSTTFRLYLSSNVLGGILLALNALATAAFAIRTSSSSAPGEFEVAALVCPVMVLFMGDVHVGFECTVAVAFIGAVTVAFVAAFVFVVDLFAAPAGFCLLAGL